MTPLDYKTWVHEEALREQVKPGAIYMRIRRGQYPGLRRRFIGAQASVVEFPLPAPVKVAVPANCVPIKVWVRLQAIREKITVRAVQGRLYRGRYNHLENLFGGGHGKRRTWVKLYLTPQPNPPKLDAL